MTDDYQRLAKLNLLGNLRALFTDFGLDAVHSGVSWCEPQASGEVSHSLDFGCIVHFDPISKEQCLLALRDGRVIYENLPAHIPGPNDRWTIGTWGYRSLYAIRIDAPSANSSLIAVRSLREALDSRRILLGTRRLQVLLSESVTLYRRHALTDHVT